MYSNFRKNMDNAQTKEAILAAATALFPAKNAEFVAVLTREGAPLAANLAIAASIGSPTFWSNYLELCRANQEPITRVLRTIPRPTALTDLQQHPRLRRRTGPILNLLAHHDITEIVAVPAIDQQLNLYIMVLAGHNLGLHQNQRQFLTQVAADIVQRLPASKLRQTSVSPPQHLNLTPRQMEIAAWIVAGKTDWEIGEILGISSKTVNFHVENIKRAYGVKSRNQFVAAIIHDGGLTPHLAYAPPAFRPQSAIG